MFVQCPALWKVVVAIDAIGTQLFVRACQEKQSEGQYRCESCEFAAVRVRDLIDHCKSEHPDYLAEAKYEIQIFPSAKLFEDWLEREERKTTTEYVNGENLRTRGRQDFSKFING